MTDSSLKNIKFDEKRSLDLSDPIVMGILNVTPDSFSDGGEYLSVEKAVERAKQMNDEGADIIDIGGESSRPGAEAVGQDEELKRVIPVIEKIRKSHSILISIDTYRAETAKLAVEAGADMINDISALRFDNKMADMVAEKNVPLVLMHMLGTPKDMQVDPCYDNCVSEIISFFKKRISFAREKGIADTKIIVDPGIGFGKRLVDNLDILSQLSKLHVLDRPVLIGTSRKSFINMIDPEAKDASGRLGGSISSAVMAYLNGASIFRVHDVKETVEALKIARAIKERM